MKRAVAVRIRASTEADIDACIRVSHAIWRNGLARQLGVGAEQWPAIAAIMHVELIPIARAMLVAAQGEQVVGYSYRNGATIEDLWVDPSFQRAGIGPRLLRAQIAAIAAAGYRTATLECLEANTGARRFYEREGWRPVYRYSRPLPFSHRSIPRIRFEYDVWRPLRPGRQRPSG